jgi:hypothetical protein
MKKLLIAIAFIVFWYLNPIANCDIICSVSKYLCNGVCIPNGDICYAASSIISFTNQLPQDSNYTRTQAETPNPYFTQLIPDNNKHTLTLSTIQALYPIQGGASNRLLYFSLRFNGTNSNCIVRPMASTTAASWVAYPVLPNTSGAVFGMGLHPSIIQLGYSSCGN